MGKARRAIPMTHAKIAHENARLRGGFASRGEVHSATGSIATVDIDLPLAA